MIKPHGADALNPLLVTDAQQLETLQDEAKNLPSLLLNSAAAANAVMLGGGYFTPLAGYMNLNDALSVSQKMQTVDQFERFALTVTGVIVAIGAVLIFTSMMGSISERKNEIGIFRAIGFKKIHIVTIILTEAFLLSIIAGLAGTSSCFHARGSASNSITLKLVVGPTDSRCACISSTTPSNRP